MILTKLNNKFTISFEKKQKILICSILNSGVLNGAYTENTFKTLYFYGESVISLLSLFNEKERNMEKDKQTDDTVKEIDDTVKEIDDTVKEIEYMSYNTCIGMMYCLSKQQQMLEELDHSFYTFCLKDILVIDNTIFLCMNPELIMPINRGGHLTFYKAVDKAMYQSYEPNFCSEELKNMMVLPFRITYKTCYSSLGDLAIYCLFGKRKREKREKREKKEHGEWVERTEELTPILNTKLYWFIVKCIHQKQLIFI